MTASWSDGVISTDANESFHLNRCIPVVWVGWRGLIYSKFTGKRMMSRKV